MKQKVLQVQLPMPIDSKRYLVGNIAFKDLLIIAPFVLLSAFFLYVGYVLGLLNSFTIVFCLIPLLAGVTGQMTKHKIRKDITFFEYGLLWVIDYKLRKKEFFKQRGELQVQDSRTLFIKDVYAGCYETDTHFVKVIEPSSVNLSLMNDDEVFEILGEYKSFLNTLNFVKKHQDLILATPVNLDKHIQSVEEMKLREPNKYKRLLHDAYIKSMDSDVQKNRELVAKKRYFIISEKIGSDREKALDKITTTANMLKSKVENLEMGGYDSITANILDNEALTKLIFTTIDYDSSLSVGDMIAHRADTDIGVTFGEMTAKNIIEKLQKELTENIH